MTKIKCLKCGDIIESDGHGKWVQCSCKSCYIDETEYYCRVGGNPNEFAFEKDGEWYKYSAIINNSLEKDKELD